jgi:adenylosuccinate synthase
VSENAPVITPMNRYLNRVMETIRGAGRHGSCGFGIGITQADVEGLGDDALYVRDLRRDGGRAKLTRLYELKRAKLGELDTSRCPDLVERFDGINLDAYADLFRRFYHDVRVISEEEFLEEIRDNDTVFEGAQGVLLDQQHGFFPHCTRSNCTFENPLRLLSEAEFQGDITRVGLLRGYATRHGAGPFPTEDPTLVVPPCHNHTNDWQGHFRNGWFDGVSARYALEVTGGVDCLAITNLDRMDALPDIKICESYESTADAEFLRNGSIPLVGDDLDVLARRTAEICKAVPRYVNVKGWADGNLSNRDTYLDTLEEIMNHEIHAFSVSPHHQKTYRCSQRIFA